MPINEEKAAILEVECIAAYDELADCFLERASLLTDQAASVRRYAQTWTGGISDKEKEIATHIRNRLDITVMKENELQVKIHRLRAEWRLEKGMKNDDQE